MRMHEFIMPNLDKFNPQNCRGFNLCMEQAIAPMFIDLTNYKICNTGCIELTQLLGLG
jgi:hypothetical protein